MNKEETSLSDEKVEKQILSLLLLGLSTEQLRNILNMTNNEFHQVKKRLIAKGNITEDKIRECRKMKLERDKNITYELLLKGYYYTEIEDEILYGFSGYAKKLTNILKAEGRITEEEIKSARFERNEKYKIEVILDGLNKGLTYGEIIKDYELKVKNMEGVKDKTIKERIIGVYKIKFIESGRITEEIIQRRKEEREKINEKVIEKNSKEEKILKLCEMGFTAPEIGRILGLEKSGIYHKIKRMKNKGLITNKEIEKAIANRQDESKERQTHIAKMIGFTRKIDENVIQTHLDYVKATYQLEKLENRDIKLLRKVIPMDAKLVSFDSVNFILRVLTKQNNDTQAIEFIDECMLACEEDKKMCEKLQETRKQIENKIIQLKEKGRRRQEKSKIITHPQSPKDGLSAGDGWEH